ncbi:peptidylprolyl isomerase [Candidatus Woesearchaeota archaeon]|nr:peptidylprolyl isomerase [Candidatus Woesearchaeota archaeon]
MTTTIKKGDFAEIEYTGHINSPEFVFDTTYPEIARKENIYSEKTLYGPISICIGENQILKGLDDSLENLEVGKEHEITLPPEKAFGKKDGKLLRLIPSNVFLKQHIRPVPGLQVNIDGALGTIRNVTGGRTIVDFNHPFAGKAVTYKVKVNRLLTSDTEKLCALLTLGLNLKKEAFIIEVKEGKAHVTIKSAVQKELLDEQNSRIKKCVPTIKDVTFTVPPAGKKEENQSHTDATDDTEEVHDHEHNHDHKHHP